MDRCPWGGVPIDQPIQWRRIHKDILILWHLFVRIGDYGEMPRDYEMCGGSGGAIFTLTSFYGKTFYDWFVDDAGMG